MLPIAAAPVDPVIPIIAPNEEVPPEEPLPQLDEPAFIAPVIAEPVQRPRPLWERCVDALPENWHHTFSSMALLMGAASFLQKDPVIGNCLRTAAMGTGALSQAVGYYRNGDRKIAMFGVALGISFIAISALGIHSRLEFRHQALAEWKENMGNRVHPGKGVMKDLLDFQAYDKVQSVIQAKNPQSLAPGDLVYVGGQHPNAVLLDIDMNFRENHPHHIYACANDTAMTSKWGHNWTLPDALKLTPANPSAPTLAECVIADTDRLYHAEELRLHWRNCSSFPFPAISSHYIALIKARNEWLLNIRPNITAIIERVEWLANTISWRPSEATLKWIPACEQYLARQMLNNPPN